MTIRTERRYDAPGRISVIRTEEGFLLTTGKLAKPGIMLYKRADGTTIRELVEPEVLQDVRSNSTLFGKAFTLEHPPEDVTPENWTLYAHGTWGAGVYEQANEQGPGLYAPVTVHTRKALTILEDEDGPRELSPGYSVKVDDTPGNHPEWGPYDTRQIPGTRDYNHGALTEAARGGPDLTIRKDSAFEVVPMKDGEQDDKSKGTEGGEDTSKVTNVVHVDSDKMDAFMNKMEDAMSKMDKRLAALENAGKGDASDEDPEADEDESDKDDKDESKKDSDAAFMERFKARKELETLAARYGVSPEGKADAALKLAIAKKVQPNMTRTDSAYIDATLDLAREDSGRNAARQRYAGFGEDLLNPEGPEGRHDSNRQHDDDPSDLFLKNAGGNGNLQ